MPTAKQIRTKRLSALASVTWHSRLHRQLLKLCIKPSMRWGMRRLFTDMHRIWDMNFCAAQSWRTIIRQEDAILRLMKFLYRTEQRAIPVIFRRFLHRITALQCVIRSTRYMWIPMLWRDVPVLMIRRRRCGAMWSTCRVRWRIILCRSFRKRHRISSICVCRTIRPVPPSQKISCRAG